MTQYESSFSSGNYLEKISRFTLQFSNYANLELGFWKHEMMNFKHQQNKSIIIERNFLLLN